VCGSAHPSHVDQGEKKGREKTWDEEKNKGRDRPRSGGGVSHPKLDEGKSVLTRKSETSANVLTMEGPMKKKTQQKKTDW